MTIHLLKIDSDRLKEVAQNIKQYELRRYDRDYKVGDILELNETKYSACEVAYGSPLIYTGISIYRKIVHVLQGPTHGLMADWVILSLAQLTQTEKSEIQLIGDHHASNPA
ncbi:MAG: DUF3850 domain-containing protein [Desulfobacter sp.]